METRRHNAFFEKIMLHMGDHTRKSCMMIHVNMCYICALVTSKSGHTMVDLSLPLTACRQNAWHFNMLRIRLMGTLVRQLQKRFSLFPALSFSISIPLYVSIFLSRSLLRHRNKHCSSCSSHFTSSANSSLTWRLIKSASALAHRTRHLSEPTADCQVSWHTVHKILKLLDMLSIGINALWRFVDDVPLGQVDEDHQHDAPSQTQSARSDSSESNVLHFPELSEHVEIWNVESGIALNLLNLV